jgi:hypothetical protein
VAGRLYRLGFRSAVGRNMVSAAPNTSLERTRADKVPSPSVGMRAAQLNR